MRLDDLRHALRAGFIVQVPQNRARIEDVGYHLSFRRRWRFSSAEWSTIVLGSVGGALLISRPSSLLCKAFHLDPQPALEDNSPSGLL
jgi:hypothetical protein